MMSRSQGETADREFPLAELLRPDAYPLAGRSADRQKTLIELDGTSLGDGGFTVISGPCAVESYEQFGEAARLIVQHGLKLMRGGAFKPRTSPYSFDGLRQEGLDIIARVKKETGVLSVTELMSTEDIDAVVPVADIVQVGSRNMQNFPLLRAVGGIGKPVLLKRGFGNTLRELLMAAEHIMNAGNPHIVLCERGIRTFDSSQRNTLDVMAVPILQSATHLPVILDPSHSVGTPRFIPAAIRAALAVGADGVIVEVHPHPEKALSDGAQSLTPDDFSAMMEDIRQTARALNRQLG
ncbi:3-deoxy-7-phosphoheptulonate synthase [bacterium]|nr:3-deoxy-7-phosphoheptulonate synthase [bacterium]